MNPCTIHVDGEPVELTAYALPDSYGNYTNYVRLRDVAALMNGKQAQFDVEWKSETICLHAGTPYQFNGSEMATPFNGNQPYRPGSNGVTIVKNGEEAKHYMLDITITDAAGGGYTYYKLRDLGRELGFQVSWDSTKGVLIDSTKPYSG